MTQCNIYENYKYGSGDTSVPVYHRGVITIQRKPVGADQPDAHVLYYEPDEDTSASDMQTAHSGIHRKPEYRLVDSLSQEHDVPMSDDPRIPQSTIESNEDVIFVPPDMRHSRDIDTANQELETLYSMLRMKLQEAQKLQRELTSADEHQPASRHGTNRNVSNGLDHSHNQSSRRNGMTGMGRSDNEVRSQESPISPRSVGTKKPRNSENTIPKSRKKSSRGILRKISGKPKKSSWRFLADMDKNSEQSRTDADDVIDPVMLKDMMGRNPSEIGSQETEYTDDDGYNPHMITEEEAHSGVETQSMSRVRKRSMSPRSDHDTENSRKSLSSDDISQDHDADLENIDEVTKFLISRGIMNLEDEKYRMKTEKKEDSKFDFLHYVPREYRKTFFHILDPEERKKALKEIYKTRLFVASYWMFAIFFVLLLLPESRFFAPFIAGYIGGRKAGNVFKGALAAMVPFMLIALVDLLVYYNFIYHFYDLYLPTSGTLSQNLVLLLSQQGVDTSGLEGSFFNPETSLGRTSIYMTVSAIIGGTLERDARRLSL